MHTLHCFQIIQGWPAGGTVPLKLFNFGAWVRVCV